MDKFSNASKTPEEEQEEQRVKLEKEDAYWKGQVELGGSPLCMPLHVKQTYDEEIQKLEQVGC
jgi:hypothetical protein